MGQRENKEQLIRLLSIIKGHPQTVEEITSRWEIDPDVSFIHENELSGKVVSGNSISVNEFYPLVEYPLGAQLDTRKKAEAR
jgi:hypothetical protein